MAIFTGLSNGQTPAMSGSINTVEASRDGQRIDNYLFTQLKGVPKGLIYRLLRTGKIRVNGKRVKQTYRIQEADEIKIPNIEMSQNAPTTISDRVKQVVSESILFEDDHLLAINKPAGLAVHPGSGVPFGVIEVLRAIRPDEAFLELVHRLDKETSGCLLIAKDKRTLNELHNLLRDKNVNKRYQLLVKGQWDLGEKLIDTPLQTKGQNDIDNEKNSWKEAQTIFTPQEHFSGFSLLTAKIKTGRTHQIRIHAAQIGFPVAGDSKHGDFAFNRECKKMGLKRMFLHAEELSFHLAGIPERLLIKAPLPNELMVFIKGLEQRKGYSRN